MVDTAPLVQFLHSVLPSCLDVSKEQIDAAIKVCSAAEFDSLQAFAQDEQQNVLYVEKLRDGTLTLGPEVSYTPGSSGAVLLKRSRSPLLPSATIAEQVQFAVMHGPRAAGVGSATSNDEGGGGGEPDQAQPLSPSDPTAVTEFASGQQQQASESDTLASLYAYLHFGFAPLLRSYSTKKKSDKDKEVEDATGGIGGGLEEDSGPPIPEALKQALPLISKRMNELEYAVRSCLQSMEIPEVKLAIDPVVVDAVGKRHAAKKDLSLDELGLGEDVRDSKMLNRLQAGVNRWVKEIQKVTKLERDASSGTVAQEVQFWHNMERALQQIQRQVDGPEVKLTLDILKQSRRALATILFENDTGMQAAIKRVSNYMILMQDFPVGALLSATDVSQIEEAITQIFSHLKKVKNADEYPLPQAMRLVEALSRDVANQLTSVLSTQQLMVMPFPDFEATTAACQSLFRTWEDHFRNFRDLVRDLAKRRGSERLPPKLVFEHNALQERIEEIRSFRAGHEKLREVIERVVVVEELKESALAMESSQQDITEDDKENRSGTGEQAGPGPAFNAALAARHGRDGSFSASIVTLASAASLPLSEAGATLTTLDEVKAAYQQVRSIEVLDVSREGSAAWENAKRLYERRIDRVERRIIERLTDKLGAAKTADEMFRVFSKFNALFFRPRIRGAIQQFQTRLIATVEDDIEALQKTFKKSYGLSQASLMSRVWDVPPVSGAILWARQIERQLDMYLKRVESVLGAGWEQHLEGRRLKETGLAFKKKLNTQQMFDQWMKSIQSVPSFEVTGRLFCVEQRSGSSEPSNLVVNFDPQIIELFKEVRNLQWLGFKIPFTLKRISDEAKEKYPFAMSLQSTLEAYKSTVAHIDEDLYALLSVYIHDVQERIESTFNKTKAVKWDSDGLNTFTSDFSQCVFNLQTKVDDATEKSHAIDEYLVELKSCPYSVDAFRDILESVQRVVDEMNLASYSNLDNWVASVEKRIDDILLERLKTAVVDWLAHFNSPTPAKHLRPSHHEIVLRKHALYLDPSLEDARLTWVRSFQECLAVVCNLRRIQSSRYDAAVGTAGADSSLNQLSDESTWGPRSLFESYPGTFADLLKRLGSSGDPVSEGMELLHLAYAAIESKMHEVDRYVQTWLQYQSLWEMEASDIFTRVGNDLYLWRELLGGIQKARATFDTAEYSKQFGPVTVNYQQVQAQVSLRYDAWHKEILTKFGGLLGDAMNAFHAKVAAMREDLERGSLDAPTSEVVSFITTLNRITLEKRELEQELQGFVDSEKLLVRQRFAFPQAWNWVANVQGEWDAFVQILNRKLRAMELELPSLQSKILIEDRSIATRVGELANEWSNARPVNGSLGPFEALNVVAVYEGRGSRLQDELNRVNEAKNALSLSSATVGSPDDAGAMIGNVSLRNSTEETLETLRAEVKSLKEVWTSLAEVSGAIADLQELPWTAVVPKKLRSALDEILDKLRKMPTKVQQYEAFEFTQSRIRSYKKSQGLIIELRSEALKERHWRQIVKVLSLQSIPLKDMTLGDLWKKDLTKFQRDLTEIFRTAQGEMALEEFLRQIREFWTTYEFDLVNYQNRCKLIRGWDELFNQLDEHTNSLVSMKQSPYFRVFEEDAAGWDDKLTRIRVVLDLWIDVQRRWVYLGGILLGSADIKQQLPTEYSRFMSIDNEFVTLMRKVSRTPRIMEVVTNMPSLDHSLTRLADLLEKIQRALGEYLERQRQSFSRFYFVGDEDLLEIIGNAKDPVKIQRHMSKMFAGISTLVFDSNDSMVEAFSSKEGEVVTIEPQPVPVQNVKVNEWLLQLERAMKITLLSLLKKVTASSPLTHDSADAGKLVEWIDTYPSQVLILASQVAWSSAINEVLNTRGVANESDIRLLEQRTGQWLSMLADRVLVADLSPQVRKKHEQLITEMVHQRDVLRKLSGGSSQSDSFEWLSQLRYTWNNDQLELRIASASFSYGFEYQGVGERLVQTPLTDRCYLALTQALHFRLGGNPFGPAGTGKTESVKALGAQLGRFVLVFNCDEHFDLHAMGRIFVGLCQVGAWGCFDEFNRLEERILSAVSQQILNIQRGLLNDSREITLINKPVQLNRDVGIFVTMNPGYAGRSNLPDNLKQLFRSIAMIEPDRELIAQVMLFSQGFKSAEKLAAKVVLLFKLCQDQLSEQPHYDFGLRAVKSVLLSAGTLKRKKTLETNEAVSEQEVTLEQEILIQSLCENVVPKLVSEDVALYQTLLAGVFPGAQILQSNATELRSAVETICSQWCLSPSEQWVNKVLQLDQVQRLRHGVMMVGPSGTGKTMSWRVLLEALEMVDGVKGVAHVIDPKAISKEVLYGKLDPNTLEWTNGVVTHILRTILNNVRGEKARRHWIIFDGDVDPEWAENLNSVLDDNKLLTLPNGERLSIPDNVRIMFEVETLRFATLATVSRCGMVWYSQDTVSLNDVLENHCRLLAIGEVSSTSLIASGVTKPSKEMTQNTDTLQLSDVEEKKTDEEFEAIPGGSAADKFAVEDQCVKILVAYLQQGGIVPEIIQLSLGMPHVMDVTRMRLVISLFSLLGRGVSLVHEYNHNHPDFPMPAEQMTRFFSKWVLFSLLWGVGGSLPSEHREALSEAICRRTTVPLPANMTSLWDYEVNVEDGEWRAWKESVPRIDIEPHKVVDTDVVISTVDTVRHVEVLRAWLDEHRPLILCGPPGSGKTMSLNSVLSASPNFEMASLNFSSATTPELILKTFEQYCVYKPTRKGLVLAPPQPDRWLVVFCDEVNLPVADDYGTQRVITFMRQIVEQGGFWRPKDLNWVTVDRIQFVSACNPPTDPGRVPLTHRFLRHTPLLFVGYPVAESLRQIYGTFNRALVKLHPPVRAHADALTEAMVGVYSANKEKFSADVAPHYVYSPRELSRWVRALYEALGQLESVSLDQLVRLWLHEGLRLFHDRLVTEDERTWCSDNLDAVAREHFPGAELGEALARPVLFANWLTKNYVSVDQEELREHVEARLRVFYEEELNVPLVVFDDVLEHVLRIDRVLRQPLGHLLLVGKSGAGKTVLSRFVAWMNGLRVFQIKLSRKYSLENFDEDLRYIMKQAGCNGERVCFIFDESNVLDSAFLERMNALLASGEVPGLFEGDEKNSLMSACREAAQRDGVMIDTDEEDLFREFTRNVQRNLHVVFTMNPASSDLKNRAATSPALFNRCVVDWFGDWSQQALAQVGYEFTRTLDLDSSHAEYQPPSIQAEDTIRFYRDVGAGRTLQQQAGSIPLRYRDAVVSCLVKMHESVQRVVREQAKRHENHTFVSPRDYLDLIHHFVNLYNEKREQLEEQQLHFNVGLDKLKETAEQVEELRKTLSVKERELEEKNRQANEKLQQMVSDQNEAEKKKVDAERMGHELDERNAKVAEQKRVAESELSEAEPALLEAQKAVSDIRKAHLDEMRSLNNPPVAVKLTLEAVCLMLGVSFSSWTDIRRVLQKREFIPDVVNFKSENLTEERRANVEKLLENPDFVEEKVLHANKACVALFKWIVSQLNFARILLRIQPLRDEIAQLASESEELTVRQQEEMEKVGELETQIVQLKEEYAVLIRETESIKTEMTVVKTKVERSMALLESLSQENERWLAARKSFSDQMSTLVGDVLLSSGFISYCGFFGYLQRQAFVEEWKTLLSNMGIHLKKGLSLVEYLCKPSERLQWQANSLPKDDLCLENAIILNRFNRFPLVVDPSGQAADFLMRNLTEKKVVKTSFLDASFMKQLESALRFGTCLVITDVENIDPVLNPVLNREIHRTGGRMLVRLGDQDIDFSPTFSMFLTTRDPTFQFAPDVCSRVTFVNFTVTPASLQSQCLGKVLKFERPDIDKQREDLLKLQGEYQVRLRELEEKLLDSLNAVQGNILDNDSVVKTLENLKNEAKEVHQKASEADQVMERVEQVSAFYSPFASMCSNAYFALERLADVHFVYHFSLGFFLQVLDSLFSEENTASLGSESAERLKNLQDRFFFDLYRQAKHALLEKDKGLWALLLAQIFLRVQAPQGLDVDALEAVWKADEVSLASEKRVTPIRASLEGKLPSKLLSQVDFDAAATLVHLEAFDGLALRLESSSSELASWLESDKIDQLPQFFSPQAKTGASAHTAKINIQVYILHVLKAFRPDKVLQGIQQLVDVVFERNFVNSDKASLDLEKTITEAHNRHPVLLLSTQGYDMSGKVDMLALAKGVRCRSIAMGSPEGYSDAEKVISDAAQSGGWVLLKNVHLAANWLQSLEKRVFNLSARADFRLIMTSEVSENLPKSLLRQCIKLVFEAPKGVRASLMRSLHAMPPQRVDKAPVERSRLYFLLAWFHAVLVERLRFAPIGWSKGYEFSDADQSCAMDVIDEWVDRVAKGRDHIAPEEVPWDALRSIFAEATYGGRIDNEFDQQILESILNKVFVPDAFNPDYLLVNDPEGTKLAVPEGKSKAHFEGWVSKLPSSNDPSWLGLSRTAETLLLQSEAKEFIAKFLKVKDDQSAVEAGDVSPEDAPQDEEGAELVHRPVWMDTAEQSLVAWCAELERVQGFVQLTEEKLHRDGEKVANPMYRCFEREKSVALLLLDLLGVQFVGLLSALRGERRMTNEFQELAHCIHRNEIPAQWAMYLKFGNKSVTMDMWVKDYFRKITSFTSLLERDKWFELPISYNIGNLFSPGAFLTASRQQVSKNRGVSLEDLSLVAVPQGSSSSSSMSGSPDFSSELVVEGGLDQSRAVVKCDFYWVSEAGSSAVRLPLYLDSSRRNLLADVHFSGDVGSNSILRGVALVAHVAF